MHQVVLQELVTSTYPACCIEATVLYVPLHILTAVCYLFRLTGNLHMLCQYAQMSHMRVTNVDSNI